jgi:hypothetical protein
MYSVSCSGIAAALSTVKLGFFSFLFTWMLVFLQACCYFGVRQLRETADIVFCPYNYLVDPSIRSSVSRLLI